MFKWMTGQFGLAGCFMSITVWVIGAQFLTLPTHGATVPCAAMSSYTVVNPDPPKTYKKSAHGTTVKDLFDINAEAVLVLTNLNGGTGDVGAWTDGESGSPDGVGSWTRADELFLMSEAEPFVTETDPVYIGTISQSASLVAGTLSAPSEDPVHVTGVVVTTTTEYLNHPAGPATTDVIYVVSRHDTIDEAEELVDDVREAEDYDPEEPIDQCINPNWLGNGGIQCCGYYAVLQGRLRACNYAYAAALIACLGVALGVAWRVCFLPCVGLAITIPAQTTCMIICGIAGLVVMLGCFAAAYLGYLACQELAGQTTVRV